MGSQFLKGFSFPFRFINLYNQAILNSPKSDNLTERLECLNAYFTRIVYENVCRSLFEKDKLVFSLVLTLGILRAQVSFFFSWMIQQNSLPTLCSRKDCQNFELILYVQFEWMNAMACFVLLEQPNVYNIKYIFLQMGIESTIFVGAVNIKHIFLL